MGPRRWSAEGRAIVRGVPPSQPARAVPAPGRDQRRAQRRRDGRGHRLGADPRTLRPAARAGAVPGRRAQPGGRHRRGRGPGGGARRRRRSRPRPVPPVPRDPRPTSSSASAAPTRPRTPSPRPPPWPPTPRSAASSSPATPPPPRRRRPPLSNLRVKGPVPAALHPPVRRRVCNLRVKGLLCGTSPAGWRAQGWMTMTGGSATPCCSWHRAR